MSQVAEKTEKRSAKAAQIKDAAFKWDDPLDLESQLSEEERMVRDTARDYAQDKLFPRVIAANRDERPAFVLEDVEDADFTRAQMPVAAGVPLFALRELERFRLRDCAHLPDMSLDRVAQKEILPE